MRFDMERRILPKQATLLVGEEMHSVHRPGTWANNDTMGHFDDYGYGSISICTNPER